MLERSLGERIVNSTRVRGGDVAESFAIELGDGRRVFAKTHPAAPPYFFTTEATGLSWLRAADAVAIPEVLAVSDEPPNHLVLEWIDEGSRADTTEHDLGLALAAVAPGGRAELRPRRSAHDGKPRAAERTVRDVGRVLRDQPPAPAREARTRVARASRRRDHGHGTTRRPPRSVRRRRRTAARLHGDLWAGNRLDRHPRPQLADRSRPRTAATASSTSR